MLFCCYIYSANSVLHYESNSLKYYRTPYYTLPIGLSPDVCIRLDKSNSTEYSNMQFHNRHNCFHCTHPHSTTLQHRTLLLHLVVDLCNFLYIIVFLHHSQHYKLSS